MASFEQEYIDGMEKILKQREAMIGKLENRSFILGALLLVFICSTGLLCWNGWKSDGFHMSIAMYKSWQAEYDKMASKANYLEGRIEEYQRINYELAARLDKEVLCIKQSSGECAVQRDPNAKPKIFRMKDAQ